jgi:hypothetical protein
VAIVVHSSIQVVRLASMTAGSSDREVAGMAAYSTKAGSSSTVSLAGNTNRFIGTSRWKRSEIRKSTSARAASGASVPARTPANSI